MNNIEHRLPASHIMHSNRVFLMLGAGAVLIHTGAMAWVHAHAGRIDAYAFNSLDCGEYYALAQNIVRHGAFSQDTAPPLTPDTWRTPGYPLFLAAGMLIVGDSPTGLIFIQHLTAIAGVLVFFRIASRCLSPARAGLASLIFLLEPYHVYYSFWLLSTTFFTFVLLLTWWTWERARDSVTARTKVTLGLLLGFLVLIWPGALLVPFFGIIGWIAVSLFQSVKPAQRHIAISQNAKRLGLVLVAIASFVPSLTWMCRNKLVAGHFSLSHQSGIVLAYFKATEVDLWRQGRTKDRYLETSLNPANLNEPHNVWDEIDARLCARFAADPSSCSDLRWPNLAQGNKTSFDSFEVSRELAAIGQSMLLESPGQTLACGFVRVWENLAFPLGLAWKPADGAPSNRLRAAGLGAAYVVLALTAFVHAIRMRKHWIVSYYPIACMAALTFTTAPQIDPRFRVPLIPCLAFLALVPARRAES